MNRIEKNEERYDSLLIISEKLDSVLTEFKEHLDDYKELSKYYGSKEWFKDKEEVEKGIITGIKAGVLSEDLVWNLFEDLDTMRDMMQEIVDFIDEEKDK